MNLQGRQGWIFDLDGTLALPVHDFDGLREALGLPQGVLILEYLASRPAAEAKALSARLEALEAELISQCRPQPGIREALQTLRDRGGHLGVVTRNSVANAHLTLQHLGLADLFAPSAVLGRESAAPKPSPDALNQLLQQWRLNPGACVMLGDHGLDLAAGRAAGVATVHFTADCAERWPELTDHCLPHWSHLGALL